MNKPTYIPPTISLHQLYTECPIMDATASGEDLDEGNMEDGGVPEESQSRGDFDGGFSPESWE